MPSGITGVSGATVVIGESVGRSQLSSLGVTKETECGINHEK